MVFSSHLQTVVFIILILINFSASQLNINISTKNDITYCDVQINGYQPTKDADYVNVAIKAPAGYIIEFEPFATGDRIHHMSLFGCTEPANPLSFWKGRTICSGMSHILYAWAKNAPSFQLPKDIAFPIGSQKDPIKYLILQVHYAHPFEGNVKDFSGIKLHISQNRPKYIAEVYDLDSMESIPPKVNAAYINMSCLYRGNSTLYPFAFLTHTHEMGRSMSAFVKHSSNNQWELIGKRNPQWPQIFQKIERSIKIENGDLMAAMCRFDSTDKINFTSMGHKPDDEMCNFYIMFYRSADEPDPFPRGTYCDGNENPLIVRNEYPKEGKTLLPSHPEWEHAAQQAAKPFGVIEKQKLKKLGNHHLGIISSMAFAPNGNLVIFHSGEKLWNKYTFDSKHILVDKSLISVATLIVAKENGDKLEFFEAFGNNLFYVPLGLFIDDENYYYTSDGGTHQVIKWKYSKGQLEVVFTLGEKFVPGSDIKHFCKPSALAVSNKDSSIFVSDGYFNGRILQFSKDGQFITQFGEISPPTHDFKNLYSLLHILYSPHNIALDDNNEKLYVSNLQNHGVQIYDIKNHSLVSKMENSNYFEHINLVHYSAEHGLFFIPMRTRGEPEPINVYVIPPGSKNFQYSFSPKTGEFSYPLVIQAKGNTIYIGDKSEYSNEGGILWKFYLSKDNSYAILPSYTSLMNTDGEDEMNVSLQSASPVGTLIVVITVLMAFLMGIVFYVRRHRIVINSRTPKSFFDNAGFISLRTIDENDESEDDY